jgi:hypothetical protein
LTNFKEYSIAIYNRKEELMVSDIEEIKIKNEIFKFTDKYENGLKDETNHIIPAKINKKMQEKMLETVKEIYKKFELSGVVRIDFLYDLDHKKLYVNEINTIPGSYAYYLFKEKGITFTELLNDLIKQALIDKENKHIYVPWYVWQEGMHAPSNLQDAIDTYNIQRVFTHADIVNEPVNIRCREIYSGHIHIPHCKGNIRNLGSTYSLNFADANSKRGFYVIDGDNLLFVENNVSIKFHRFYNGDIFTIPDINKNDYIELYINQSNMSNQLYLDEINNLVKNWKNVWLIPQTESKEVFDSETFVGYDIETIAKEMIPENLKQKFNQILHILE